MKKLLLTIGLATAASLAFGQGTVQFSNGTLYRLSTAQTPDAGVTTTNKAQVPITAGLIEYGLFYGIGESTSLTLLTGQYGVNSTTGLGLIASPTDGHSALTLVGIPGTSGGETDVFAQMVAWAGQYGTDYATAKNHYLAGDTTSFWGQSAIVNLPGLGATTGPGAIIWQSSTGTNPKLFNAFAILQPTTVPEPATFALAGLGAAALMIFRRRK